MVAEAADDVKNAGTSALNLAQIVTGSSEQFLDDSKTLLSHLAQRALTHEVISTECNGFLSDFRDLPYAYANFLVVDANGRLICSAVPLLPVQSVDYSDRQWFQRVAHDDQFTVGAPVISRTTGKWVVPLAYPLHNAQGTFVGALSMPLDLPRYQFMVDGVTLPPNSILGIVNEEGIVIAHAPNPDDLVDTNARGTEVVNVLLTQSNGYTQARGMDGIGRIFGFTSIPSIGWHIYIGIPTDAVLANMRVGTLRSSLIALSIMIIALTLATYLGQRIAQPIRTLARAARDVMHGQLQTRVRLSGPLEIAQVAAEFNAMLDARAQVERALRDSEARLRLVIDQLPMMLWTTDADLRFTSSLGKGFQSVNLKPNYLAGRSLAEVLNTTDPQLPAIQAHRQALKGQSAVYELDWAGCIYESHVEPMRDDQGNIIGCIGVALDITEGKQAEAALRVSKERFQAMIENSSDGIVLMTAERTITYATPGATRLTGFTIEPGSSLNRFDLIHPDDLEQLRNEWSALLQQPGSTSTGVYRVRYKDDSWHWVERVLHNLLLDPSIAAIVSNYRDVTERKQAEDALRQYAMRLVDAQEAARRQLARDLHDQVGTHLTALGINLNVLRSELSSRAAKKVEARLSDSTRLLDEAQDRIRGVMTDLYPAVLDDYGLNQCTQPGAFVSPIP